MEQLKFNMKLDKAYCILSPFRDGTFRNAVNMNEKKLLENLGWSSSNVKCRPTNNVNVTNDIHRK